MTPEVPVDDPVPKYNQFKTLVLLRCFDVNHKPIYLVIEGISSPDYADPLNDAFFYDEHTCPTDYIPIAHVLTPDDDDPYGCFEYVRSVWMPAKYVEAEESEALAIVHGLFPEIKQQNRAAA